MYSLHVFNGLKRSRMKARTSKFHISYQLNQISTMLNIPDSSHNCTHLWIPSVCPPRHELVLAGVKCCRERNWPSYLTVLWFGMMPFSQTLVSIMGPDVTRYSILLNFTWFIIYLNYSAPHPPIIQRVFQGFLLCNNVSLLVTILLRFQSVIGSRWHSEQG